MKSVTNLFDCPSCFVHADEVTLISCCVGLFKHHKNWCLMKTVTKYFYWGAGKNHEWAVV
jgi:hypothetical protein